MERGHGFALIDPHGDLVGRISARIPASGRRDVIYLDATNPDQPYGYNPLRHVREDRIALGASGMMDVFKKMWPDAWSVRMEHILRNVLMALLEQPDATLHEVIRIFSDKDFRRRVGKSLRNETVRTFLLHEFDRFSFGATAQRQACPSSPQGDIELMTETGDLSLKPTSRLELDCSEFSGGYYC